MVHLIAKVFLYSIDDDGFASSYSQARQQYAFTNLERIYMHDTLRNHSAKAFVMKEYAKCGAKEELTTWFDLKGSDLDFPPGIVYNQVRDILREEAP